MNRRKLLPVLLALAVAWLGQTAMAQVLIYDDSDAPFTILPRMVTVTSPNGGENWNGGSAHDVTWTLDAAIAFVNIHYSTDNGASWLPAALNAANSGSRSWTLPAVISTTCLVRVSAANHPGNNDFSDRAFSISDSGIETVTAPDAPSGPASGTTGNGYSFSVGGANSNFGDPLQYRIDWGDGTDSGWLVAGTTSASHAWAVSGTYAVRAKARCATHTSVESPWSEAASITIAQGGIPSLLWNTFMGGGGDYGIDYMDGDMAVDGSGNIYITGWSNISWGDPLRPFSGSGDVFVAKLNASGVLLWHTFLGGNNGDFRGGIFVDGGGDVYVTGGSDSTWGSPLSPFSGSNGFSDVFLAKLSPDGALQFNTFLGGASHDSGKGITVDGSGSIYITGYASSNWGSPINPYAGGSNDAFIAKFNAGGMLQWNTFLGGSGVDAGWSIRMDNSGNALVSGSSDAAWGSPVNAYNGGVNTFVAKLDSGGTRQWHTFMGGGKTVYVKNDIAVDHNGNVFVAGQSGTWGSPLNPYSGGYDAFLAKLNPSGARQWNTFLGGSAEDGGADIALDGSGNIYIAGNSTSTWGSPQNPYSGGSDAFAAAFNNSGARQWHTFLGGTATDHGTDIALDNKDNIYVAGDSTATWGSPLNPYAAREDVFLARLGFYSNTLSVIAPNGGEDWKVGLSNYITWSLVASVTGVTIEYSIDNGGNWLPVAENIANRGIHSWTVPDTTSPNCLVRVSDAANPDVFDASDAVFTIFIPQALAVTSPNGGESWTTGESHDITWSSAGAVGSIAIDYSTDNGSSWTAVAAGEANDGNFAWTVPDIPSTTCLVRVSDEDGDPADQSDSAFTIAAFVETVSTPTAPAGPSSSLPATACDFSTGGSACNMMGHAVQYKFDWGDGTDSGWLAAGTTSADHAWTGIGTYRVRAMARCAEHTAVESSWSEAHYVFVFDNSAFSSWNTFMGGSTGGLNSDGGTNAAVDNSGNIYVTGYSLSSWGDPVNPFSGGYSGYYRDVFAAKFNPRGELQWNTFLGSDYGDVGQGIAIDGSGNVYMTGISELTWGSPVNPHSGGNYDAFVAKLNASGVLQWNTFMGRSNSSDMGNDIAVDGSGNVYIAGYSASNWGSPLNPFGGGSYDAFAAKLDADGARIWHTFLGGDKLDQASGIALDASGSIFVTGRSCSTWGSPLHPFGGGFEDAFLARLNADGTQAWHTFLGGNCQEEASDIALDINGNIYMTGYSICGWGDPLNPFGGGANDALIAKFNPDGMRQWHTFLGGDGVDSSYGITVDGSGSIFATGWSGSSWGNPLNPFATGTEEETDAFVIKLNGEGELQWNTFLGGTGGEDRGDLGRAISTDASGNILVVGWSGATWGSPLIPFRGDQDAFLAKLDYRTGSLTIVTSPNGGESWAVGSTRSIAWSRVSSMTSVNIDYSTDGGGSWTAIAAGAANTGSYAWTVPYTPSDSCLVRVSDAADPGSGDGSDAAFSIYVPATLTISGTVTLEGAPVAGVLLSGLPGDPVTDDSGFYAATVAFGWSGTVTPSLQYFTFTPASTDYVSSYSNQSTDYAASISQPLIVTSPAAGAQWERGLTHAITWVKQGEQHEYVRIYLFKGTNTLVKTLVAQTDNDGSYDWAVPANQVLGTTYYIRVKTADGQIYDNSDKFSIIKPTITVTAPASGTVWAKGTVKTIAWTKQGTQDESVKIQLYKGTAKALDIALETENDGSYDWPIPSALAGSSNYTVRVATLDGLVTGKGKAFTITAGTLQVTQPEAGTAWERGLPHVIAWSGEGTLNANVRIDLYKGTTKVLAIVASTPTVDGAYTWTIPAGQALSSKYKVRIRTLDNLVKADSGKFSIVAGAGLALTAPNGNEALQAGEPYDIRWTDDAGVLEVKLEFSRDNGGTFATIADHVEDTGSFEWTVPVSFTANGIVRVSDAGGRLWQEEGLLEYAFKFMYMYNGSGDDPGMGFWFGSADVNAPSYGFGRIDISGNAIGFGGMTKAVEPLAGSWHELRVRLDLRRDTAVIYLDDQVLFEHAALGTTRERYFEPGLALQAGSGEELELALDDLAIRVIRQDAGGEDREAFGVLKDDFERYDAKANPMQSCWQVPAVLGDNSSMELNLDAPKNKSLRLRTEAGKQIMLRLPFALPEKTPFDASDKNFAIENRRR